MTEDEVEDFLDELSQLQKKYGIYVESEIVEDWDYDYDDNAYLNGVDSYLVLEDGNGNVIKRLWD